jgi:hypothetical protein
MKVTGLDYAKVLERYDRGMRLVIQTNQPIFHTISAGIVEIPVKVDTKHAW